MKKHEHYMRYALELAKKGSGRTSPNPLVGAVIVKDDKILGEGWHKKYGGLHAERNAFKNAQERGNSVEGATMYVTLEPCCHYGKTPPCTEAIIENKIEKVFIGSSDPNPAVAGKGVQILKKAGIQVIENVLKEDCDKVNEIFFHYIQTGLPFVMLKYAMTLDGKIATVSGKSKWITSEAARLDVHKDRSRYKAIMAGLGTVVSDDPMLTSRIENGINPIRIICDTNLNTPYDSKLVKTAKETVTIIATSVEDEYKYKPYVDKGCTIITVPKGEDGHLDLSKLLKVLGEMEIDSIYIEGGGSLNWSALKSGMVNKIKTYIAPKLFGGEDAKSPVRGLGVDSPQDAFMFETESVYRLGPDTVIESRRI